MSEATSLRVGIDVGGTFTDVVAVDAATRNVVARIKVPTTHDAPGGIAVGIVAAVDHLLANPAIRVERIRFIAHSTTQATNALLEADLAQVGVIGLLDGLGWLSKRHINFGVLALPAGGSFAPSFQFARTGEDASMRARIDALIADGAQAIAASRSFGVDRPAAESQAVAYARSRGVDATSGHDVSTAYGLRARTRTAALNAAILPRMVRTARVTGQAVERAAIPAPLMVMRSDGGVMSVREIERRPILTLLSGPAAGVAGALLYERLSDGIFIEVGGTSSDCSAIRGGRPQMRPARIGGHRTMLRTLDVRTVGIGGGSMLRIHDRAVIDVGPRSAHIAGCAYASFVSTNLLDGATYTRVAPTNNDPDEYAVLLGSDGSRIAPTVTCAANALDLVPAGAFSCGSAEASRRAFDILAQHLSHDAGALARRVLTLAASKVRATILQLIADYELDSASVTIVGGGGGAGALVPAVADSMGLSYRIARDAEVIAPIGVALALVRDSVERTIVAPSADDIARIRREVADRVVAQGASPDRVEVEVEIDSKRNRVRATASGSTGLVESAVAMVCSEVERRTAAATSLRCDPSELRAVTLTSALTAFERRVTTRTTFGRLRETHDVRVVDDRGAVRLALRDPISMIVPAGDLQSRTHEAIERATSFGDVGRAFPAIYVLRGSRVAAFEGLSSVEQGAALAAQECEGCEPHEPVALFVAPSQA